MQTLSRDELDAISGGETVMYYVGYGLGLAYLGTSAIGSAIGSAIYDATH